MSGPFGGLDFGDMLKSAADPELRAKMELGSQADAYMSRTLTILQMMWYAKELMGEQEADKMMKPYQAAISLMGDQMNAAVEKYTKEHGEI